MRLEMILTRCAGALVVVLALTAAEGLAQQEMSEEAMMEAMAKAATPGKPHQWLASKAGTWAWTGTFWMDPSQPPQEATGTAERTMMLGGRVLAEKVSSPGVMGQPFEGYGLAGYDNVAGEFWGTWNDNMGTGVMVSRGKCDDKGACTYMGEYMDPMTGKKKTSRMTSSDQGPDKEVHQFFDTGPDGKEFKSMELVYTRKK